jgi:exodeoxyribonuclease III
MRIVSWNVNGIRAVYKKGLQDFVSEYKPDIFCLQETKAHIDQVEEPCRQLGYKHSYWSSAKRKGYSGVATFCNDTPKSIKYDFGISKYEDEGRIALTEHEKFDLYNIYFPNGGSGPERHDFKQEFLADLAKHLKKELARGRSIVVVGDYNIGHSEIDVYDPVRLSKESGFLPEERQWMSEFLELGFVDTFRHFHPDAKNRYSWWSYRELARISNRGWRIDYICISKDLLKNLKSADILDSVEGSDHCPVIVELD